MAAALIHRAIGKQLTCVFVNHGLLRLGEPEQVQSVFRDAFDMNLVYVDASDRFLDKLLGVTEPERKRKIIGAEFSVTSKPGKGTRVHLRIPYQKEDVAVRQKKATGKAGEKKRR